MSQANGNGKVVVEGLKEVEAVSAPINDSSSVVIGNLNEWFADINNPTHKEIKAYAIAHSITSLRQWEKKAPSPLPKHIKRYLEKTGQWTGVYELFGKRQRKSGRPKQPEVISLTADVGNGVSKAGNSLGERVDFESQLTISKSFSQSVSGLFKAKDIRDLDDECYYQVGKIRGMNRYDSKLDPFSQYSKIELLPLFLVGVITRMPKVLASGEKVEGKVRLKLNLHLTTLAETGEEELRPELDKFLEFEYESVAYVIEINKLFTYREGTGSAYIANNHVKANYPDAADLILLDCGGGTLSESYWAVGDRPRLQSQTSHDAGILILRRWFCKYAKTGDNKKLDLSIIESAFRRASHDGSDYTADSKVAKDLGISLPPAFEEWVKQNFLQDVFFRLIDAMDDGAHLYLCGGGFKNEALLHFIKDVFEDFESQVHLVPDPHLSNINGLLDPGLTIQEASNGTTER